MEEQNTQVKVKFPENIYNELRQESETTGVTMASLVKLAVAERHRVLGQRVPYRVTEKGRKQNGR